MRPSYAKELGASLVQVAIAVLMFAALLLVGGNADAQRGLPEACSQTARMEIYSDAWFSDETGDVNGFELALEPPSGGQRKALLFVYEGEANTDGIPLAVSGTDGKLTMQGTWVEHMIEYPSKREVVQKRFVRITAAVTPDALRGKIMIEAMFKPTRIRLRRVKYVWLCTPHRK